MAAESEPTTLVELEGRLLRDTTGELRAKLDAQLMTLETDVQQRMREMMTPEDHATCRAFVDGLAAARRILAVACRPSRPPEG